MKAATLAEKSDSWIDIIPSLEEESPEYRSIAYEGASFEIAMKDLATNNKLHPWKEFKNASRIHSFHVDIGLGWAFAKTGVSPQSYVESINDLSGSMVLDGIGYYHSLYKGRSTLKNKTVPPAIEGKNLDLFDQGVGRRLWYMAKGNEQEAIELLHNFAASRHGALFRGIGIACGYVGGCKEHQLKYLKEISASHLGQLQFGITLAGVSRVISETVTPDIDLACRIICDKTLDELRVSLMRTSNDFLYLYYNTNTNGDWFSQLKSKLLKADS